MITVTGYPSETEQTFSTPTSFDSNELVRYLIVKQSDFLGDEYIDVEYNSETIRIYIETECRYTPVEVHFQNKEGAQQTLTFFKARTDRMNVDSEQFETDRGQPLLGNHQFIDYNKNGKSSFKVNSGFVDEVLNDSFKQLVLSERVWVLDGDVFVPVNIKARTLEYKTRQKDRLINYEIEFEYSYNEINNV